MKKYIFIIALLTSFVHSTITSYETIRSFNKITLSLKLDKPFLGKISKSIVNEDVIIKIPNKLKIKNKIHNIDNNIVSSIVFSYSNNSSKIKIIKSKEIEKLIIEVEKSFDGKSISISITPDLVSNLFNNNNNNNQNTNQVPEQATIGLGSYIFSISLIAILLVIYFMAKRKTNESLKLNNLKGYKLIFVRQIDLKTKLIVFELNEKRYIVMSGSNFATLIDKIASDDSKANFDFYLKQVEDVKKEEDLGNL